MTNTVNLQLTPQGVLIPYEWLIYGLEVVKQEDDLMILLKPRWELIKPEGLSTLIQSWLPQGLEIVQETEQFIIRPKPKNLAQILTESGLLASPEPLPADFKPLSVAEKTHLTQKLSLGHPLSEIIIEERADRV